MIISQKILIKGTVQGVGFRPFIHRMASHMGVKGWVRNIGNGVELKIQAEDDMVEMFCEKILSDLPAAAQIDELIQENSGKTDFTDFEIVESAGIAMPDLNLPPDICLCNECSQDISDTTNRRYLYPFTSCINCGPRFTILDNLPYDRRNVTMRSYIMCPKCSEEYLNIADRRYHAQPICCPDCGPQYKYGDLIRGQAVDAAVKYISDGGIVAVKGWGGFHLMGDAENIEVIKQIRRDKHRRYKPIAVVARNTDIVEKYCVLTEEDRKLLLSFRSPIMLLSKKIHTDITEALAPENTSIGIMLPYSGIQKVVFEKSGLDLMIATSLNRPSAPTIRNSEIAHKSYQGEILDHDLYISFTCDDSVVKSSSIGPIIIRRSRGYVPESINIPFFARVLTSGASENLNFCYTKDNKAYPSQYLGDAHDAETQEVYIANIRKWRSVWNHDPERLGCDMHPGYETTRIFKEISREWGIPLLEIQHHHAHLAGCAAENNLNENLVGVAFDGLGYGDEGQLWGGEFMLFDYHKYHRLGSIKPQRLPGGDQAAKEPWRMAVSYLDAAGVDWRKFEHLKNRSEADSVKKMLQTGVNVPYSSSVGRLFDAVAAIIGLVDTNTFSARAPIALESLVNEKFMKGSYNFIKTEEAGVFEIDTTMMIQEIAQDVFNQTEPSVIASRFHQTLAEMIVEGICVVRDITGIEKACLSGGVFCNSYLTPLVVQMAEAVGIEVFWHNKVSPSDNGISFGQAVICAANRML